MGGCNFFMDKSYERFKIFTFYNAVINKCKRQKRHCYFKQYEQDFIYAYF